MHFNTRVTANVTSALNHFPYLKAESALPTDPENDLVLPSLSYATPYHLLLLHMDMQDDYFRASIVKASTVTIASP